jgi:hypothetical protein
MLLDATNARELPNVLNAPVVIIGAGTVGLFLAVSLARSKIPTILVEAGGRVVDTVRPGQTAVSVGKVHHGTMLGRAFGLGGTSTLWRGQLAEFDEWDLTAPGREWPIPYSELKRCYEHVYAALNIKPQTLVKLGQIVEKDHRSESGVERFCTFFLPQQNFALRFRADIRSNPLLKVILNATANDILFAGSKATAVRAVAPGGREIQISGQSFVFACGTLEICRFFLSIQRRSDVPWKHNRNIGAFFQDHYAGKVGDVYITDEKLFRDNFEPGFISGHKYHAKLRYSATTKRPPFSGMAGYFRFASNVSENIDNLKFVVRTFKSGAAYSKLSRLPADIWSLGSAIIPLAVRFARDRRILAFMDKGVEFEVLGEQIPIADSAIRLLVEDPQPDGLYRAEVRWKLNGGEITHIRDFALRSNAYLQENKIASISIDERLLQGDRSILEEFGDFYHQSGGMCIGASESSGVVDSDCRVWGTSNVYLAGASVFPSSSHANCTLTALALAGRLASLLERSSQWSVSRLHTPASR